MKYRAQLAIELEMHENSPQLAARCLDSIVDRMRHDWHGNRITRVDIEDLEPVVDPSRSIP